MIKLATLCYVRDQDKILMLLRNKKADDYHIGKWNGLGGKFEEGESPEECAKREIFEESGLTAIEMKMKGIITFPKFDNISDWYVYIYLIDKFKGTLIDSPEGLLNWIPQKEIQNLNLWPGDKIFLEWIFRERFFSAKFIYEQGEFKDYTVEFY